MSEVEKMYEKAGVEKKEKGYCDCDYMDCPCPEIDPCSKECLYWVNKGIDYPPFTAEKQLEITKFLLKKAVYYDVKDDKYWFYYEECESAGYKPFDEAIAHFINKLWQDLTSEDKQQVKGILE